MGTATVSAAPKSLLVAPAPPSANKDSCTEAAVMTETPPGCSTHAAIPAHHQRETQEQDKVDDSHIKQQQEQQDNLQRDSQASLLTSHDSQASLQSRDSVASISSTDPILQGTSLAARYNSRQSCLFNHLRVHDIHHHRQSSIASAASSTTTSSSTMEVSAASSLQRRQVRFADEPLTDKQRRGSAFATSGATLETVIPRPNDDEVPMDKEEQHKAMVLSFI